MPTVYLKKDSGGKVLLVGGKAAISSGCCCSDCPSGVAHMAVTWSVSGAVAACHDHAFDIPFSASGTGEADLSTEDCCLELIDGTEVDATCPEDCGIATAPSFLSYEVHVCWNGETWTLTLIGTMGNICGNGDAGIIQDFSQDLGVDPVDTWHVEVASNNGSADWIFDVTVS